MPLTEPPDPADPDGATAGQPAPGLPVATVPVPPTPGRRGGPLLWMAIVVVAILAGGALFLSGFSLGRQTATTPGTPVAEEELFRPFWDAYRAVTERYAGGEVDRRKIIEGAIRGMFEALGDPYSSYLTSEQYRQSLQGISGEFEGIGAEIATKRADGTDVDCNTLGPDCRLVVVAPIEGSPAEKAGVRPGDVVVAVDGSTLDGLTLEEARDRIRGPKGTEVTITIERDRTAPFDLTITRDVIVTKEVTVRDLAGGTVSYIRVSGFSDHAADDVAKAVKAAVENGQTRFVLDLRGNPGGFVTAAQRIASQFIASGPIFWQEDAQGNQVPTEAQTGGAATDPSIKVVVLIDRGSASASEIVAAALQDSGRAELVGEQSFGKGTVQTWQPLEDDAGGFRLTVAKWLTPDMRWIHHVGLTPDVKVDVPADTPAGTDPVLEEALEVLGASTAAVPAWLPRAA